ncbi:hypothetical protein, partial [Pseudomonas viridiflava]
MPAFAETVQLTNAGFKSQGQTHTGNLDMGGSYSGSGLQTIVGLNGSRVDKDLILNAAITSSGGEGVKGVSVEGGK